MEARGGLDRRAHGGHTRAMSRNAGQVAAFGPAAIAVHDDGDVVGQPLRIEAGVNLGLFAVQPSRHLCAHVDLAMYVRYIPLHRQGFYVRGRGFIARFHAALPSVLVRSRSKNSSTEPPSRSGSVRLHALYYKVLHKRSRRQAANADFPTGIPDRENRPNRATLPSLPNSIGNEQGVVAFADAVSRCDSARRSVCVSPARGNPAATRPSAQTADL